MSSQKIPNHPVQDTRASQPFSCALPQKRCISVLILREEYAARRTRDELLSRGFQPLCAPLLTYKAHKTSVPILPTAFIEKCVLILTSSASLRSHVVCEFLRGNPQIPVVAVGDHSAEAARISGAQTVFSAHGDRFALKKYLAIHFPPPTCLLWAMGQHYKKDFIPELMALGYPLIPWEVYSMEAASALPSVALEGLRKRQIDAVLHYSRRTAEIWCSLVQHAGFSSSLFTLRHVCISEDVAQPLKRVGVRSFEIAPEPTEESLLACLGEA
jgi:uroporphyrinogen-III synthase